MKTWRVFAISLFCISLLVGGLFGNRVLALTDELTSSVTLFTELIEVAHERYPEERSYRDLVYSSIHGMLRSLDPHTSFLSRESYDSMRERQQSSFYGLGIYVGQRNGRLTVITPIPGTPGAKKGLRAGDVIFTIDGESTDEMSVDDAISKLKGPKDTDVTIEILRANLDEPLELTVTRAEIPQQTVQHAYMLTPDTGFVHIRDFSRSTTSELARALGELREEGMERLILDLRFNGGGLLDQAITVSEQFVPKGGMIVETRGRIPSSFSSFRSEGRFEPLDLPLVVLVNGGSASASEIVSGAIQDHDVGLVVGEATWGKGLVQTVYSLPWGAGLALTTARYYTPAGRLIQRDYTSYWDYYTGYDDSTTLDDLQKQSEETDDADVFLTDLGRKVYGGGGITPDIRVETPDLHPFVQKVLSRSGYFTFIVDYGSRNAITRSWKPSDAVFEELQGYLVGEGFGTEEEIAEAFAEEEVWNYTYHRLRSEAFNGKFGLEEGHRAFAAFDPQVSAALEQLDEAAELLERRRALGEGAAAVAGSL